MSSICLYLVNILTEVNMSLDKNSIAYALIDAQVDNIQKQQKQDALNYSIFELRATLKDISNEVDKLVQRVEQMNTRNGS
tara:strand:+ start:234 stop:473 length:240 start_codon:yes stop_codon:yes gene_type:complete